MNILNLKLVILLDYQNIKTFLLKTIFQISLKKILLLKKLKTLFHGPMLLVILKTKKIVKKNCKKTNQREFIVEKVIRRKDNKLYVD